MNKSEGITVPPEAGKEPLALKTSQYAQEYCQRIWENPESIGHWIREIPFVQKALSELAGTGVEFEREGLMSSDALSALKIFSEHLLDFIEEKSDDPKEKERLHAFAQAIYEGLFSASTSLMSELSLADKLALTGRANRIPIVQGWFGQNMASELVYSFSFVAGGGEKVAQHIATMDAANALDAIEQLKAIGAGTVAHNAWAEKGTDNIREILHFLQSHASPLARYAAQSALQRLTAEESSPTLGTFTRRGNPSAGRLPEQFSKNSESIQIASDAVAELDQSGTPQRISRLSGDMQTPRIVASDPLINPFGDSHPSDTALVLQRLHSPQIKNLIEADLGISLTQISLRSQIHFLAFLAKQDTSGFDRLRSTLQKNKESASSILNSFLANAEGREYSETILSIAEKAEPKGVEAIFKRYSGIVQAADAAEKSVAVVLPKLSKTPQAIIEIRQSLLRKANSTLSNFEAQIGELPIDALLANLERIKEDTFLMGATFRVARRRNFAINLEDILGNEISEIPATEIAPAERATMMKLFEDSHAKHDMALRAAEIREFQNTFNSDNTRFYILRFRGIITGFYRFDNLPGKMKHFGSFNVEDSVQEYGIGSALLETAIEKEGLESSIELAVLADEPRLINFYKRFGFQYDGGEEFGGKQYMKLVRPATHQLEKAA